MLDSLYIAAATLLSPHCVRAHQRLSDAVVVTKTLPGPVTDPKRLLKWNYDGSSTGEVPGEDIKVICDAYTPQGDPIPTNQRAAAVDVFSRKEVAQEEMC
ncbi:unnamed protein product [Sphagnum jensenii]|uniref:Uncharacterized protein n=1 Tax=Sphagnum jensenii TaxID=128206 RepID=A0ABP1BF23_9BRYO